MCPHATTVRTEEVARHHIREPLRVEEPLEPSPAVEERIRIERRAVATEAEPEPRGVLSTAVHVVGELLALPFRLVGGLLRLIF